MATVNDKYLQGEGPARVSLVSDLVGPKRRVSEMHPVVREMERLSRPFQTIRQLGLSGGIEIMCALAYALRDCTDKDIADCSE